MSNNNGGPPQPTQETLRMWAEQNEVNGGPPTISNAAILSNFVTVPSRNTSKNLLKFNSNKKTNKMSSNLSGLNFNRSYRSQLISNLFAPNKIGGRRKRSTRKSRKSRKNKRSTRNRK